MLKGAAGRIFFTDSVAAPEPKRLIIIEGAGHNDLSNVGGEKYIDTLAEFVRRSIHSER